MSASAVEEEMKSLSATGPQISVSALSGSVEKVTPSPIISYATDRLAATGAAASRIPSGSR